MGKWGSKGCAESSLWEGDLILYRAIEAGLCGSEGGRGAGENVLGLATRTGEDEAGAGWGKEFWVDQFQFLADECGSCFIPRPSLTSRPVEERTRAPPQHGTDVILSSSFCSFANPTTPHMPPSSIHAHH